MPQLRGRSLGTDEPSIALRPGLWHAIVTENNRLPSFLWAYFFAFAQ